LLPKEAYIGLLDGGGVGVEVGVDVNVAVLVGVAVFVGVLVGVGEGPAVGVFVGNGVFVLVEVGPGLPIEISQVLPSFSLEFELLSMPRLTI
jgi:hypothetical protein